MEDMGSVHKEVCCNIYVGSTLEHVAIEKFYQRMDKTALRRISRKIAEHSLRIQKVKLAIILLHKRMWRNW